MGLFNKLRRAIPIASTEMLMTESEPFEIRQSGESIAMQKLYEWSRQNLIGHFDIQSIEFLYCASCSHGTIIDGLARELHAALEPAYLQRNRDFGANMKAEAEYEVLIEQAKIACERFIEAVENRTERDPYLGKGFLLHGTFKYGTHNEITRDLEASGLKAVTSDYYADYIIIGCKPTKHHPSSEFSDVITRYDEEFRDYDGYHRIVLAEDEFEPLQ